MVTQFQRWVEGNVDSAKQGMFAEHICFSCGAVRGPALQFGGVKGLWLSSPRSELTLTRCGRCKQANYCSEECQVKHWKAGHKEECVSAVPDASRAATAARSARLLTGKRGTKRSASLLVNLRRRTFHIESGKWCGTTPQFVMLHTYRLAVRLVSCRADCYPLIFPRCKQANYCSEECQHAHWKAGHKEECQLRAMPGGGEEIKVGVSV